MNHVMLAGLNDTFIYSIIYLFSAIIYKELNKKEQIPTMLSKIVKNHKRILPVRASQFSQVFGGQEGSTVSIDKPNFVIYSF